MSSDSELEEFVDALDDTLVVQNVVPRVESPVEQTDNVEEEEKRILKLQKKSEERRKKEDNEIKKRWEEVKKKKEEERIQNIEEQKWKAEECLRRRKLEEMRQRMLEEATPTKSHDSSSSGEDDPVWEDGSDPPENFKIQNFVPNIQITGELSTGENLVHSCNKNTVTHTGSATAARTKKDITPGVSQPHSVLSSEFRDAKSDANLDKGTGDNLSKHSPTDCRDVDCEEKCTKQSGSKFDDFSQNRDLSLPSKEKASKDIPEITCKDYEAETSNSSNIGTEELEGHDYYPEPTLEQEEPDIVKSAKPRHPPQSLMPPVAPPRRKKKKESSSSSMSPESRSPASSSNLLASPGLPPAVPTPTSTVEFLTRDLENSLDIQSAIGGRRHINAQDAEIGAVNSDHSTPSSDQVFTPTETSDHSKLDLAIPEEKDHPSTGSEGYKEKTTQDQCEGQTDSPDMPDPMGRPRSNSGRLLTDEEILEQVTVLNLDTGEKVPLNLAEDAIPQCMNPLSLHIMRRTKEYSSDTSLHKEQVLTDDETKPGLEKATATMERSGKWKAMRIKKFIGKTVVRTVGKVKSVADQSKKVLHGDDVEEEVSVDGKRFKSKSNCTFKACSHNKGPYDFSQFRILQDLGGEHTGAVWTMKFSPCGRLLATGGQDNVLRIWVLTTAYGYFEDLRQKYSDVKVSPSPSPAPSQESLDSLNTSEVGSTSDAGVRGNRTEDDKNIHVPFIRKPFCTYRGHSADLLDVSWSKNYFILSSSMDKTVRLWHISRRECLCTFQHIDFVTAIVFHPRDDRYFLSGSLDGKLRLWNIPDKKVTLWNEVSGPSNLITTANFCQNGKFAVVGTYDGKCIFYSTDQLKYYTQIHVRSTRGKNARGRKITGIEPMLGEDRILVTSNDSRIRLYDLRDLTLTCKYKGGSNNSSQIKSSFSPKGKYIICGSEDHFLYIWKTQHELYKFSSARRDRSDFWEAIKVHNAVVTAAIFAPCPALFAKPKDETTEQPSSQESDQGEIIISVDFTGMIKVIQNKVIN